MFVVYAKPASRGSTVWTIHNTHPQHLCPPTTTSTPAPARPNWRRLALIAVKWVLASPSLAMGAFEPLLQVEVGIEAGRSTTNRVLLAARRLALGLAADSYTRLQPYFVALRDSAPGSATLDEFAVCLPLACPHLHQSAPFR